tara:strand:+ start:823 stop:1194 length:372 start_codon:yes stop_codon:yes gene_type:complete
MEKDLEIFSGKTFSGLLKDIYTNAKAKERQIDILIKELKPLIKNIGDATVIVPLIKDYLDIAVKNDDHLIKMAAIVQRATQRTEAGESLILTDEEKKQLLEEVEKIEENIEDKSSGKNTKTRI